MDLKKAKKLFHIGDIVCIKSDLTLTDNNFTATDKMREMVGTNIKVKRIRFSHRKGMSLIEASGFNWHPSDLYVVEHINPGELITDGQEGVFTFDEKQLVN